MIQSPNNFFKLSSPVFIASGDIPKIYTCDGLDVNPPLLISGVPEAAKSLALIVDDPDAPFGDFTHWILWNIAPDTAEIKENSVPPEVVEGTTDFERSGWGGPCPPSGTHRYRFKLYALDITLDLPVSARKKELEAAMHGHILDQTVLVGKYAR